MSKCDIGHNNIIPKNTTLLKGAWKKYTAISPATGIKQHRIIIHMCDFFMNRPPVIILIIVFGA
jgi:hypothetical protein